MRTVLSALLATLVAGPAFAGVTKFSTTIVPLPNTCDQTPACISGTCSSGLGACAADADCHVCTATGDHCSGDSDCSTPVVSPASKAQVLGTGVVKVSVRGVTGPGGTPVTTDGIPGSSDDYVVDVQLANLAGKPKRIFVKMDLEDGKGTATADGSGVLPPEGTPMIPFLELLGPPTDPSSCPGTNAPEDVVARTTGNCATGRSIGSGGLLVPSSKTKMKAPLVGFPRDCINYQACVSGFCNSSGLSCSVDADCQTCNGLATSCTTNADCNVGVPSAKSKFQMMGNGDFRVSLTGALDVTGQPLTTDQVLGSTDDFVLAVVLASAPGLSIQHAVYFKTDFLDGKAKLAGSTGSVLPATGTPFATYVGLSGPPYVPADCPGTNSLADVAARVDLGACSTGAATALGGVLSGQ